MYSTLFQGRQNDFTGQGALFPGPEISSGFCLSVLATPSLSKLLQYKQIYIGLVLCILLQKCINGEACNFMKNVGGERVPLITPSLTLCVHFKGSSEIFQILYLEIPK